MSADTDTLKGFKAKWDATAGITAVVPGGLETDERLATTEANTNQARRTPYAKARCMAAREIERYAGTEAYWDYRHVQLEVYGVGRTNVGTILSTIKAAFPRDAGLTIDNATFKVMHPVAEDDAVEDNPTPKDGADVHVGKCGWEIWSIRTAQ